MTQPQGERSLGWVLPRAVLLLGLALAAAIWPIVSLPAAFLTWLGWLTTPKHRRLARVALAVATAAAGVGVVRFVVERAAAGVVKGGTTAMSQRALSRLREVVFAQDAARRLALVDRDDDGIGSALLLGELAGATPIREGARLGLPILSQQWQQATTTPLGPAVRSAGYLFIVCLPTSRGWTAVPGTPIDEERAERTYAAYAWPDRHGSGFDRLFFVDAYERVLVGTARAGAPLPYVGSTHPPPCDAAWQEREVVWRRWRNKEPRTHLPGDVP